MKPMPGPAPAAPRPMPSASAIALPAWTTGVSFTEAAMSAMNPSMRPVLLFCLVLRLDGRADVDGGKGGEDERLDRDHDHDLEDVEDERGRQPEEPPRRRVDDENEADHREDEDVAREHVRVEPDREADQPHELRDDLDRDDQRQDSLRQVTRDPGTEVADR